MTTEIQDQTVAEVQAMPEVQVVAEVQPVAPVVEKETKSAQPTQAVANNNASQPIESFNWEAYESGAAVYGGEKKEAITEKYDNTLSNIQSGEVVEGRVTALDKREVLVNIGFKSEGVISIAEFRYDPELKVGDTVEVYVESAEDKKGQLLLSHKKARQLRSWDRVNEGDHKGVHQVPHQGRYDRRRVWHRGLLAGLANRRKTDPGLRYLCR